MAVSVGDDVDAGDLLCLIKVSEASRWRVFISADHADCVYTSELCGDLTMILALDHQPELIAEALAANPDLRPTPNP